MPQKTGGFRKKAPKSIGSKRKHEGRAAKPSTRRAPQPLAKNKIRDKAARGFMQAVEASMATKLPSDQRDKLTILRTAGAGLGLKTKIHKKKPLVRGRKRKNKAK